jgi:hypothetical protein
LRGCRNRPNLATISFILSNEFETLDQLLGGDMSLATIRCLYPEDRTFLHSIHALLQCGDVQLLASNHEPIPQWRWRELFVQRKAVQQLNQLTLSLTDQGLRRV